MSWDRVTFETGEGHKSTKTNEAKAGVTKKTTERGREVNPRRQPGLILVSG